MGIEFVMAIKIMVLNGSHKVRIGKARERA